MPTLTELARLGAKQVYADLQEQLRAIVVQFPDLVDEYDVEGAASNGAAPPRARRPVRRKPLRRQKRAPRPEAPESAATAHTDTDALVQVLQATMVKDEPMKPTDVLAMVKTEGYRFAPGINEIHALSRVLAKMAKQKMAKKTGHARGTRYVLLKSA